MHPCPSRDAGRFDDLRRSEEGFTLVEMVIAVTISAIVFTAVAAVLGSGLKTLAVQKARTQGNEVATQGIEDLQRYSYANLAVCGRPAGPVPPGLGLTVVSASSSCPPSTSASAPTTGDEPCTPPAGTPLLVPRANYSCSRINITFNVRRYVAWTDAGQTAKRLAVFVSWTDLVGDHEVSQQSSLRAPASGDVVGLTPPGFTSTTVSPQNNSITAGGLLGSPMFVTAQSTGLTDFTNDRVFVAFRTVEDGNLVTSTLPLTSGGSPSWTGTIPAGTGVFPIGSQYLSFTAVRAQDNKTGSKIDTSSGSPSRFNCVSSSVPSDCPASSPPTFTNLTQSLATVHVDAGGALTNPTDVTITTRTTNLTAADSVSFQFVTKNGTANAAMVADASCDITSCTWTGTISRASGFAFNIGLQSMYFLAAQDGGGTAAAASSALDFVTP